VGGPLLILILSRLSPALILIFPMAGGTKSDQGAASMDGSRGQGGGSTAEQPGGVTEGPGDGHGGPDGDRFQGDRKHGGAASLGTGNHLRRSKGEEAQRRSAHGRGGLSGLVHRSTVVGHCQGMAMFFSFLFASETTEPEVVGHIRQIL
jgi:hypothetical protein